MNRARITLALFAVLVLVAAVLAAAPVPPTATPTPTLPTTDAAFLASLAAPAASAVTAVTAPVVGVPTPTPMACPTGFCAEARRQCNADCAPCRGISTCIIAICDTTCGCSC